MIIFDGTAEPGLAKKRKPMLHIQGFVPNTWSQLGALQTDLTGLSTVHKVNPCQSLAEHLSSASA